MPTLFLKLGYENRVLNNNGFHNITLHGEDVGFNLDLFLNYYRGMPLSCVANVEVDVDGERIPEHLMMFALKGKSYMPHQLKLMYNEFWGVKTPLSLQVFNGGISDGEHNVKVRLEVKSPYMSFGPGHYGMIDSSFQKTIKLGVRRELV